MSKLWKQQMLVDNPLPDWSEPEKPPLYFYCPKTMLGEIKPAKIDPASFNPRKGIITRYGQKLLEEGAKYYKKINLKELIDESESKEDSGGGNNPQIPN